MSSYISSMMEAQPNPLRIFRTLRSLLVCIALTGVFYASTVHAQKLYVSGYREIMLRAGPSGQHKILSVLKTGDEMKRLGAKGDYYRVSLSNGKRGYVLKAFVATDPPPAHSLNKLEQRVKTQAEQLEALRRENARLTDESTRIATDTSAQNERLSQLEQERAELRRNTNIWWFLAGAGVLFLGWLMGWTRFRLGRRTRNRLN